MKRLMVVLVAMVASAVLLTGCGDNTKATGTLQVALTDRMSDDCQAVVVTIKEIRAVPAGRENDQDDSPGLPVIARFDMPKTFNVLTLKFQAELLGQAVIPAGSYSQLRLILADNPNGNQPPVNYVTLKTAPTIKVPLKTPSGQQSGLKVLGQFTVEENRVTAMMLDFDPNSAIVVRGNGDYNLKPTGIRLVRMDSMLLANYGSLAGTVVAPAPWNGAAFLAVKRGAATVASGTIFSHYTSGSYQPAPFSGFVPAGSYKVHLSATGFKPYSSPLTPVTVGAESLLGDITLLP